MTAKKEPPVSARQLRRHYALLSKVAEKVLTIGYQQETMRNELAAAVAEIQSMATAVFQLANSAPAFRSEVGERLRMIELELEAIGTVVPTLPRWTKEQRQAFENGDTDRKIASGLKHEQNLMERV